MENRIHLLRKDLKINEEILEEPGVESVENRVQYYKSTCLNNVPRIEHFKIRKQIIFYYPRGHRIPERPP